MSTRQQRGDGDRRQRRRGKADPAREATFRMLHVATGPGLGGTVRRRAVSAGRMSELDEGERVRRWRRGMRTAEEIQRQLRAAEGPRPAQAVAECLSALSALDAMGMWPGELDPISKRQVDDVRRRWARIEHRARAEAVQVQTTQSAALSAAIRRAVVRFQVDVRRLARTLLRTSAPMRGRAAARRHAREPGRR